MNRLATRLRVLVGGKGFKICHTVRFGISKAGGMERDGGEIFGTPAALSPVAGARYVWRLDGHSMLHRGMLMFSHGIPRIHTGPGFA